MNKISTTEGKIRLNWCNDINNFGDELSPYLIKKLTGHPVEYSNSKENTLYAIGSILNFDSLHSQNIIWGSGTLHKHSLDILPKIFPIKRNFLTAFKRIRTKKENSYICSVRGPLTRQAIISHNIPCPELYGDPAILIRRHFSPNFEPLHKAGLILHYTQSQILPDSLQKGNKLNIISMKCTSDKEIENCISTICQCEKIYSTSLHGLIIAQTYGIPAQWVQIKNFRIHINQEHKFLDYFYGVKAPVQKPIVISLDNLDQLLDVEPTKYIISDSTIDKLHDAFPFELLE